LIIGLSSIFVSSKYEETSCIYIEEILVNAGHNQFNKKDILNAELDMLLSVEFNIHQPSIYTEASIILGLSISQFTKSTLKENIKILIHRYVYFFSILSLYCEEIMALPLEVSSYAVPLTAIKYVLKLQEEKEKSKTQSHV
jgi:hypothetical protein